MQLEAFSKELFSFQIIARSCIVYTLLFRVCIDVFIAVVIIMFIIMIVIFIMMYIVMYIAHPLVHGEVCSGCEQPAISKLPLVDVEPDKIIIIL